MCEFINSHTLSTKVAPNLHRTEGKQGQGILNSWARDFPGGAVVKNLPANAGDTGSMPGPGRSHMPWSS